MTDKKPGLLKRIRCIKTSLDKAEKSFIENEEMRGELDLMLAEAEMQNLKRKKNVPWNWNRQLLALCMALVFVIAGAAGWYFTRVHYKAKYANTKPPVTAPVPSVNHGVVAPEAKREEPKAPAKQESLPKAATESKAEQRLSSPAPNENRVNISKAELNKLVRSARTELKQ